MKICIDAGHGGGDSGAVGKSPFRLAEKDVNLSVAERLVSALQDRGCGTLMTRRVDRTLSLSGRAIFANRFGSDCFVSIHMNAAATPAAEGIEVFGYPGSQAGSDLAGSVLARLVGACPDHRDRGVKEADFAVLRLTRMPAILVECEFISNPQQLQFLANQANQEKLAQSIADGLIEVVAG